WTSGFGVDCAATASNSANVANPSPVSSARWASRRHRLAKWAARVRGRGVWPTALLFIAPCRSGGSILRDSFRLSPNMTRYAINETAVYDKYVRWCGRTGSRGPSYPIELQAKRLVQ